MTPRLSSERAAADGGKGMIERIVLFDVDHTLVRGNLTVYVFADLMFSSWKRFVRGLRFLPYAAKVMYQEVPELVEHALSQGDLDLLDRNMQTLFGQFYCRLGALIDDFGVTPADLQARAIHLFDEEFAHNFVYELGLQALQKHLADAATEVVLVSGTAQEILDPFHAVVQRACQRQGLDITRLKAYGTGLPTSSQPLDLCMGGGKINLLQKYHAAFNQADAPISHVYSDNKYLSDLPLLLLATEKRVVISECYPYYKLLPEELFCTLVFAPEWHEKAT